MFVTTLGIVYVQLADREIPMTYASRYQAGALQRQAYLPFKARTQRWCPLLPSGVLTLTGLDMFPWAGGGVEGGPRALAGAWYLQHRQP